ncbi:MAG: ligand-binding sensor domain-containing protein, partial [Bacteroidota bacterium]
MQYFSFASSKLFLFFLLITFNQILFATPLSNSFHVFENYSIEDGLPDYTVNTIFQDSYGYLWIGTANGLCRYDGYTIEEINICKDFGISKVRNIYCFHEDENNDVLIGTDNGLFKFRRVNESIELIAGPDTTSNLLPISNFAIKKILSDSQNNLWIGTYNGLYKVDKNEKVKTFLFSEVAPVYVTDLLFNDETELFFSTNIGLMRMNIETETIDHFPHFHENEINVPSQKYATSLQAGLDGKLFVGTWGMGLYVFDMNKEEYVRSYVENPEADNHISSNVIFSLNSDNEGNIWIGTENSGLNKLNINTNVFTAF